MDEALRSNRFSFDSSMMELKAVKFIHSESIDYETYIERIRKRMDQDHHKRTCLLMDGDVV